MPSPLAKLKSISKDSQYSVYAGVVVSSPPDVEPVTIGDAKDHLRVDVSDDDFLIHGLIKAARVAVERHIARSLITQTLTMTLDRFPDTDYIDLPRGPVQSVTSIKTYDEDNIQSTFSSSDYIVDMSNDRVALDLDAVWPTDLRPTAAVTVEYVTGYGGSGGDVPEDIVTAIKLLVGAWYENREAFMTGTIATKLPEGISMLLDGYKRLRL